MIFKQLQDEESSTYTYLLACQEKKLAILIDPVLETVQRDLNILNELDLKLDYTIETHIHADHVTGSFKLKEKTGCNIAGPLIDDLPCRDIQIKDNDKLVFGNLVIRAIYSPGHTNTHFSYIYESPNNKDNSLLFSGDSLLINSCGRTDFQSGSNKDMFNTIKNIFYKLPEETLVYPGHDYNKNSYTTIGTSREKNPVINNETTIKEFIENMDSMDLSPPKKINIAVPINEKCGQIKD
ncbi:MAG: Zn-dependent hydrolase [Gammaproteobacteria bacterium]|nr:Zn-dependent hydrolase [Gammaproteobacteria bacterium]|tara:strand:- start:129 stop:842 length:714 start_codon:yes stop_codon:yes gene_type:complete